MQRERNRSIFCIENIKKIVGNQEERHSEIKLIFTRKVLHLDSF